MIRTLLATTAIVAVFTGGVTAQTATEESDTNTRIFNSEAEMKKIESTNGYFEANMNQILATTLLGKTIYTNQSEDADAIGDVNDVVMTKDGRARAVVVGVGGFLGLGEKEVAVDFSRLNWVIVDGDRRLMMDTTADELKSAPEFDRDALEADSSKMAALKENKGAIGSEATNGAIEEEIKVSEVPAQNDNNVAEAEVPAKDQGKVSEESELRKDITVVDRTTIKAEDIIGARVYSADKSDLGEIDEVLLTTDGQIQAFIVDVGGFIGIGEKPVALEAAQLEIMSDTDGEMEIHTSFTEEQLKGMPTYDERASMETQDNTPIQ